MNNRPGQIGPKQIPRFDERRANMALVFFSREHPSGILLEGFQITEAANWQRYNERVNRAYAKEKARLEGEDPGMIIQIGEDIAFRWSTIESYWSNFRIVLITPDEAQILYATFNLSADRPGFGIFPVLDPALVS